MAVRALINGNLEVIANRNNGNSDIPIASTTQLGNVKIGEGINVNASGKISVDSTKVANSDVIGNIDIDDLFNDVYEEIYG